MGPPCATTSARHQCVNFRVLSPSFSRSFEMLRLSSRHRVMLFITQCCFIDSISFCCVLLQLDVFYAAFYPYIQPLLLSLIQLLMAAAPNVKKYSGPIVLFRELMPLLPLDSHRVCIHVWTATLRAMRS